MLSSSENAKPITMPSNPTLVPRAVYGNRSTKNNNKNRYLDIQGINGPVTKCTEAQYS
jgi:hypothetical protein